TDPVARPCQDASSVRFLRFTGQPSLVLARYATTAASAWYPTQGLTAMFTVRHGLLLAAPVPRSLTFAPQPANASTATPASATARTHFPELFTKAFPYARSAVAMRLVSTCSMSATRTCFTDSRLRASHVTIGTSGDTPSASRTSD